MKTQEQSYSRVQNVIVHYSALLVYQLSALLVYQHISFNFPFFIQQGNISSQNDFLPNKTVCLRVLLCDCEKR